jgi:hypothetical protein
MNPTADSEGPISTGGVEYVVKIRKAWKGIAPNTEVVLMRSFTTCDWDFEFKHDYLFWVDREGSTGVFHSHICGRTQPMNAEAADDLHWLRELEKKKIQ